jgi:DNA-binding MarR family transcriptional regulator
MQLHLMYLHIPMSRLTQHSPNLRREAADALDRDAGWHLRRAARQLTQFLDERLAPAGLGAAQFSLMCLIASAPDDTIGALAERAGLDQSTLSRNVDLIARAGWAEVVTAETDRRRRAVWLTESGIRALEAAMPHWHAAQTVIDATVGRSMIGEITTATDALRDGMPGLPSNIVTEKPRG